MNWLERAFDLGFTQVEEFPQTTFKTVGILGGGTAGYLAALLLNKTHPDLKIEIIESSRLPVIGVGESTTTEIVPFLHYVLGIDPVAFFKEVEPTFKLGIQFDWGPQKQKPFNFNFFASHHNESNHFENSTLNSNWVSVLMNEKRLPILDTKEEGLISLLNEIPFAYHLDNKKFVSFLKKEILKNSIGINDCQNSDS